MSEFKFQTRSIGIVVTIINSRVVRVRASRERSYLANHFAAVLAAILRKAPR